MCEIFLRRNFWKQKSDNPINHEWLETWSPGHHNVLGSCWIHLDMCIYAIQNTGVSYPDIYVNFCQVYINPRMKIRLEKQFTIENFRGLSQGAIEFGCRRLTVVMQIAMIDGYNQSRTHLQYQVFTYLLLFKIWASYMLNVCKWRVSVAKYLNTNVLVRWLSRSIK